MYGYAKQVANLRKARAAKRMKHKLAVAIGHGVLRKAAAHRRRVGGMMPAAFPLMMGLHRFLQAAQPISAVRDALLNKGISLPSTRLSRFINRGIDFLGYGRRRRRHYRR